MAKNENNISIVDERNRVSPADPSATIQIFGNGETWNESAHITSLSRNGAGFSTGRECTIGRLVKLEISMPAELRAYDESEDVYPVMGLVQHCHCVPYNGENIYQVGVALIGKKPPESFANSTLQNYRISGMSDDGLWNITEVDQAFKGRKAPRFSVALDVTIALIQSDKKTIAKEKTVTKNVGAGGAAVLSLLKAKVGDKVKFACRDLDFYALAFVRDRRKYLFGPPTLHLEFVDAKFPVELLPSTLTYVPDGQTDPPPPADEAAAPPPANGGGNFEFERFQL